MRNLLALAVSDSGATENERAMAQTRLDILLSAFNMTVDDLMGKEKSIWFTLPTNTALERDLAIQVTAYVTHHGMVTHLKGRGKGVTVECTESESIEIERIYTMLRPLFNAEIALTVSAFYNAHDLFSGETRDNEPEVVVTAEMIARWKRVKDRTKQIDRVSLSKQLSEGT